MAVSREGVENPSCGWIAMDMGNIALHLLDQVLDNHFEPVSHQLHHELFT